jgi:SAM-dependent methyltransferase
MEQVNCYHCGSDRKSFYATENGYTLVKCDVCGLLYVSPRPSVEEIDKANMFGVHEGNFRLEVSGQYDEAKVEVYLSVLGEFFGGELDESDESDKSWLDIGCGHGEFIHALEMFSQDKVKPRGLEPNVNKQESARKRGLDVGYFDLETHDTKYDFISLLNVYSHLPDPMKTLTAWRRLLKPGGEIFLETGDTASLGSEDHYRPFNLPSHLSFASQDIVVDILRKVGFEITKIRKYPVFEVDFVRLVKEAIKYFLPNRTSRIKYLLRRRLYVTDMYIRARLK